MHKKILFGVLNWGLGHATRSIPIINQLMAGDFEVIITSDGDALKLLKNKYPTNQFLVLPSYNIQYSNSNNQFFKLISQVPQLLKTIQKEKEVVDDWLAKNNVDYILSDNRYGVYNTKIKSIFIGHQLSLDTPIFYTFIQKQHAKWINKFDKAWVIDDAKNQLVPKLSNNPFVTIPKQYIGWQSRFNKLKYNEAKTKEYEAIAIISGPEPQRSIFEKKMVECFSSSKNKTAIVGGSYNNNQISPSKNITYWNNLPDDKLWELINNSSGVICRSGYSSVMDYILTKTPFVVIPTPGQSEQEYLASTLNKQFGIQSIAQSDIPSKVNFSFNFVLLETEEPNILLQL